MDAHWQNDLRARGVAIGDSDLTKIGHVGDDLRAATSTTVICDLSHLGLIRFSGEDTRAFLQGQLSCDLTKINPVNAQYGGYCSPKGRLLAVFLLWQSQDAHFLQLPGSLREPIQKRIGMFVLRSKLKLTDATDDLVRLGIAGPAAETAIGKALNAVPGSVLSVRETDGVTVIRLDAQRFELVVPPEKALDLWNQLSSQAVAVGAIAWNWLEVRAGIPVVFPVTQDQFIPQMANLELVGGVSFQKGCYPGQEIVARTQFLGRLKRRMYLAHVDSASAPVPGDPLFSPDSEGQASGTVANAAPAPGGGFDILAIIQMSSAEAGEVHLQAPDGPRLRFEALPYPL
jgi:tRNA-modifying protein YgfZ